MSTPESTHQVWDGQGWVTVTVPTSGGEGVMIPVLRVVVVNEFNNTILLQRRDAGSETVRGLLEIPGGRWRSGESPVACAMREVFEETGVRLSSVGGVHIDALDDKRSIASIHPLVVVAGVDGGFPAVHTVLVGSGSGEVVHEQGASIDVRWWPIGEVFHKMATHRDGFIPSTYAALAAYAETLDSGI